VITLIWAQDRNGNIGTGSTIPWHCPEDLRHFVYYTKGKLVVVGRRTFDTLPRLPDREVVVMSRTMPGALRSVAECLRTFPNPPKDELIIAGGAQVYKSFLPYATRLVQTTLTLDLLPQATQVCSGMSTPCLQTFRLTESQTFGSGAGVVRTYDRLSDPAAPPTSATKTA